MSALTGEQIMAHWPLMVNAVNARCRGLDRTTCEQIAGDAVLKAWAGRHSFTSGGSPAAWLLTIARRTAIDYVSAAKNRVLGDGHGYDGATLDAGSSRHDDVISVRDALAALPDEQREYLTQRASGWQQKTLCPRSTSYRVAYEARAYDALRDALGETEWHG